MIFDGLTNNHKEDILTINTFPEQLDYSDTRKQQPSFPSQSQKQPLLSSARAG